MPMRSRPQKNRRSNPDPNDWKIGGATPKPNWGCLDLSDDGSNLPKPGEYVAVITDLKLIDNSEQLRAIVDFRLEGSDARRGCSAAIRSGPVLWAKSLRRLGCPGTVALEFWGV